MKRLNTKQTLLMVGFVLGFPRISSAQRSASANATATVIQGLTMTNTNNLRFGGVIPGSGGGTVIVSPSGSRSATGTVTLLTGSSIPYSAASFSLLGQPNLAYTIVLPTSAILTQQGGSATIVLSAFTSSPAATGTLSSSGIGTLTVGGTVTISSSQAAGYYVGAFSVTLTYQ